MGSVNYTSERIIVQLREVKLLCGQGKTVMEAVRQIGISEQTYYRWRKKYGGMTVSDAKKYREDEDTGRCPGDQRRSADGWRIKRGWWFGDCSYAL